MAIKQLHSYIPGIKPAGKIIYEMLDFQLPLMTTMETTPTFSCSKINLNFLHLFCGGHAAMHGHAAVEQRKPPNLDAQILTVLLVRPAGHCLLIPKESLVASKYSPHFYPKFRDAKCQ